MNKKIIFRNLSYIFLTNFVSLGLSTLLTFIVPKIIGINEFSYWQLYVFYSSYVGLLHLGLPDGVYLLLGGKEYQEIDKQKYGILFLTYAIFQLLTTLVIFVIYQSFFFNSDKYFVVISTLIIMVILNLRIYLLYILQATNRIKDFSIINIIEKIMFIITLLIFILLKKSSFKWLIVLDILSKSFSMLYSMYLMKDLLLAVKFKKNYFIEVKVTFFETINIGSKLLISNIASMLIIGIIRFGIEVNWDIETFGQISLSLNISNLLMIFINSIGIVIFPLIKKLPKDELSDYYTLIRENLVTFMLFFLMLFFPLKEFLYWWLPAYRVSVVFMGLLFPICLYEGKMSLLVNTYMKSLRMEKTLLQVNIYSLLISILLMYVSIFYLSSLNLAVASIVVVLSFRSNYSEYLLSKILRINIIKNLIFETIMVLVFIFCNMYLTKGWILFIICLFFYIVFNRNNRKVLKKLYSKRSEKNK